MRFNVNASRRYSFCCTAMLVGLLGGLRCASAGTVDYTPSLDIVPTATFAVGNDERVVGGPGVNPFQSGDVTFDLIVTHRWPNASTSSSSRIELRDTM